MLNKEQKEYIVRHALGHDNSEDQEYKELLEALDSSYDIHNDLWEVMINYEIQTDIDEQRRWSVTKDTICKLGDRYFSLYGEYSTTQAGDDDEYEFELTEVVPKEVTKIIYVNK